MVTYKDYRIQCFNKILDTEYPEGAGRFPWSQIQMMIQRFNKILDTEHPDWSRYDPMVTDTDDRIQCFN